MDDNHYHVITIKRNNVNGKYFDAFRKSIEAKETPFLEEGIMSIYK